MAEAKKPGWWYPYIFVGAFGVVIAVNGALAYFATSSFTGLSTTQAYDKGLAYNQNLALARAQEEMGWTVETTVTPASDASGPKADIAVTYVDRDGKPVEGLTVTAAMTRPTLAGMDFNAALEPKGNGVYGGVVPMPVNGVWDMELVAIGTDVSYQHAKRFVLP